MDINKNERMTQLINLAVGEGASVNSGLIDFPPRGSGRRAQLLKGKYIGPMFLYHL